MCGMNLAFDRRLIGPAMWFGLMGEGQPLGRYDDMWAGWCSKVVCDHLGLGVKTGKPYVWHSKASDPLVNLEKEFKGIMWQEKMVEFFRNVKLPKEATTAAEAYAALASELRRSELATEVDPYFLRVAEGMETWLEVWKEFNPVDDEEGRAKRMAPRVVLSEEEKASASASGPASSAAVLLSAAAGSSASSASPSLSAPAPSPAAPAPSSSASSSSSSSKSVDEEQENNAPFTPLVHPSSRPQQLAGKGGAATAAAAEKEEEEIAGLFERKAAV